MLITLYLKIIFLEGGGGGWWRSSNKLIYAILWANVKIDCGLADKSKTIHSVDELE